MTINEKIMFAFKLGWRDAEDNNDGLIVPYTTPVYQLAYIYGAQCYDNLRFCDYLYNSQILGENSGSCT